MKHRFTNPKHYPRALLIDIDGTVLKHDFNNDGFEAIKGAVDWVNEKYKTHGIFFFTSRLEVDREITEQTLKQHGFKYDAIIFGKPYSDYVVHIDDRKFKSVTVPRDVGVMAVTDDDLT